MDGFINLIVQFYRTVLDQLNFVFIGIGGYNVSFGAVLFVCIAFYMIISIYWRGTKG